MRLKKTVAEFESIVKRMPADYSNLDGEVTEEIDRVIGRATFLLTSNGGNSASAMTIDQRALEQVCGKAGGCDITMLFRQLSLFDSEPKDSSLSGPCGFTYQPDSGEWSLGIGCEGDGAKSGVDGDQSVGLQGEGGDLIVESGGACILAESDLGRAMGQSESLARDHGQGLFLIAMPSRQPEGIRRFQCELVLG